MRPSEPAPVPAIVARATIHDPRSCEPDEPLSPAAAWAQIPDLDASRGWTMGFTGGRLFLFTRDHHLKHRGLRIDPKTRQVQTFDATPLAEGERPPSRVDIPEVRCIAGELVFWGDPDQHRAWGAIYNPARDAWRKIQPYGSPASSVSSTDGKRLYVFEPGGEHEISGAAYDPATDRWLPMAPGPAPGLDWLATPRFVGGKMIVWGCKRNHGCSGAAYDPIVDTWQPLPPLPAAIENEHAVHHREPFVFGDSMALRALSPDHLGPRMLRLEADRWTLGPVIAIPFGAKHDELLGGHHQAFLWSRTWNERYPRHHRTHRLRIAPDLSTTEIAKPSDPRAEPAEGPVHFVESALLQAAGSLFVQARVERDRPPPPAAATPRPARRRDTPEYAVWILN